MNDVYKNLDNLYLGYHTKEIVENGGFSDTEIEKYILSLDKPKRILDISSGMGFGCKFIRKNGHIAFGNDYSKNMVYYTKLNNPEIQCFNSCYSKLQTTEKMDIVIVNYSLYTKFANVDFSSFIEKTFANIHQILDKNGILIFNLRDWTDFEIQKEAHSYFNVHNDIEYHVLYKWNFEKEIKTLNKLWSQKNNIIIKEKEMEIIFSDYSLEDYIKRMKNFVVEKTVYQGEGYNKFITVFAKSKQ